MKRTHDFDFSFEKLSAPRGRPKMGAGIFKGDASAGAEVEEKSLLELLPSNGMFKPGARVKFMCGARTTVSEWTTRLHGTVLEATHDSAFYTIRTPCWDIFYDVPYFFVCSSNEDLFFDDFFKVGMRVMFRHSQPDFKMGTVTAVHHVPVTGISGCLDIRCEDGKTRFHVQPGDYSFPYEFYIDIIGRYQLRRKYIRPSRADVFKQVVQDAAMHVANEHLDAMVRTTRTVISLDQGWLYSHWKLSIGRDLGFPDCVLDTIDDDKFVEKVVGHMGANFQWHKKVYDNEDFEYTIKMRPSKKLLLEIHERGLFPTENPGVGGALYREAHTSFAHR